MYLYMSYRSIRGMETSLLYEHGTLRHNIVNNIILPNGKIVKGEEIYFT